MRLAAAAYGALFLITAGVLNLGAMISEAVNRLSKVAPNNSSVDLQGVVDLEEADRKCTALCESLGNDYYSAALYHNLEPPDNSGWQLVKNWSEGSCRVNNYTVCGY